jgi:hypothetical protein
VVASQGQQPKAAFAKSYGCVAIGGVLLFAVNGHPGFLNVRVLGLILILRGLAGLWSAIGPAGRTEATRKFKVATARGLTLFETVTAEMARDDSARTSLEEIFAQPRQPDLP